MNESNVAILARLEAKPEKAKELENFLKKALSMATKEAQTCTWFALKFGPESFGIFDTFTDDAGREAHLNGEIAVALMANAAELLVTAPEIVPVEVLAAKVT